MDLGYKPEKMDMAVTAPPTSDQPDTIYPTFGIDGKAAEEFMEEHAGIKVGDEVTATVRLRLTTLRDSEERYQTGKEVRFSVCELNDVAKSEGDEDEDEDEAGEEADADGRDDVEEEDGGGTGNPAVDHMMRRMRRRGKAS